MKSSFAGIVLLFICLNTSFTNIPVDEFHLFRKGRSKKERIRKPTVLLFWLHNSDNKIEAMKIRGMEKDIPKVIEDEEKSNKAIVKDFSTYFDFCKVYYFNDSSYEYVKNKNWERVKFYEKSGHDGLQLQQISNVENYLIADVSYNTENIETPSTNPYFIFVYDSNFIILKSKLGYTQVLKPKRLKRQSYYLFKGAEKLNKKMKKYFK